MIRLDAFAYTTFKLVTDCFFPEPEAWELLEWFSGVTAPFGVEVLPEVHEHDRYQLKPAEKDYGTNDFALPMIMLHTRYHHTNRHG